MIHALFDEIIILNHTTLQFILLYPLFYLHNYSLYERIFIANTSCNHFNNFTLRYAVVVILYCLMYDYTSYDTLSNYNNKQLIQTHKHTAVVEAVDSS